MRPNETVHTDSYRHGVDFQPGNGTRYEVHAFEVNGRYLVAFPDIGTSYWIDQGASLSIGYIQEKFGTQRSGRHVSNEDAYQMGKAIEQVIPGAKIWEARPSS